MRVISQDGMMDVPYEKYCFGLDYRNTCNVIAWDMLSTAEDVIVMGNYNSKEKAMKAMEMMRNAYTGIPVVFQNIEPSEEFNELLERTKTNGIITITDDKKSKIEYVNNVVFQFPKDEEVEV